MPETKNQIPAVLAGPIVRRALDNELVFWLVTSEPFNVHVKISSDEHATLFENTLSNGELNTIAVGKHAYVQLITLHIDHGLPEDSWINYDISFSDAERTININQLDELCYTNTDSPRFWYTKNTQKVLHGSCRKPHFDSPDGLVSVEQEIAQWHANKPESVKNLSESKTSDRPPALLMMSGDQVYIDDVAGPMLTAIHQVIALLGLHSGQWQHHEITNSEELFSSPNCYYQRDKILPLIQGNDEDFMAFFSGKKKPVFTSVSAHNHLISFAEVIAMYLLVWSPELWPFIQFDHQHIGEKYQQSYQDEQNILEQFIAKLPQVRRGLAHIPTYMIFDDHDVTDDWNLSRLWEEDAYGHPFSKRIIGNALIGYWLCQGWGNNPQVFDDVVVKAQQCFFPTYMQDIDELVDELLHFNDWHYSLSTSPKVVVLDTRTHRWRSENNAKQPSGLMDWESLIDLQQDLFDEEAVIMISPAPIFGVKIIEIIQRIFTFFGQALTVDAENWMAHKGTANVILNIFQHSKTPPHFIILSGDVHYSFVYDILIRNSKNTPHITQVTCSGIKNQFPAKLLKMFAFINACLFSHNSPLNLLTKRRGMEITARRANGNKLLNQSGIGLLELNKDYQVTASVLNEEQHSVFEKNDD